MVAQKENLMPAGASIIRVASSGDADAMRALLAEGADANYRGGGGHTALMVAAIFNHVDIARLLLAAGADAHLRDTLGLTARDWADRRGSWDIAQLLSNVPPAEIESSPENAKGDPDPLKVEAVGRNPEAEQENALEQDPIPDTEEQMGTKADPQYPEVKDVSTFMSEAEADWSSQAGSPDGVSARWSTTGVARSQVEAERRGPSTEPMITRHPDAVRFMKFHKQIMAAQARRRAEQTQREVEETRRSSPIKKNSQHDAVLSEQGAIATWSSTSATRQAEALHQESPIETTSTLHDASLSEQGAIATWSSTGATHQVEEARDVSPIEPKASPQQDVPRMADEQQGTQAEQDRRQKEDLPTATQSTRIAATIEHLRHLEKSSQSVEGEVPGKSDSPPGRDVRALDLHDPDSTLERRTAEMPTRTALLEPKTGESFNNSFSKRCPECNAVFENPLVRYCAYDAAKLISSDTSTFSSTASHWSRPTLWALVALTAVLGAYFGYLINKYRSGEIVTSAPIATQTQQPQITRNVSALISGALSGMEVDVPEPGYPAKARAEGVSGIIKVRVEVNRKGRVVSARSSGGDWRLRAAAVEAAQRATFSAEKLAAHGRVVSGTIIYKFIAQPESPAASGSPVPAQTNSPSAIGSSSATGSSGENVGGDYAVVGGPLVGAESNLPRPDYPERAKSKGINGPITVVVRVNREGKVISWRTLEGDSQLRAAALKAARKATFSPAKLSGSGDVLGTITYNFRS